MMLAWTLAAHAAPAISCATEATVEVSAWHAAVMDALHPSYTCRLTLNELKQGAGSVVRSQPDKLRASTRSAECQQKQLRPGPHPLGTTLLVVLRLRPVCSLWMRRACWRWWPRPGSSCRQLMQPSQTSSAFRKWAPVYKQVLTEPSRHHRLPHCCTLWGSVPAAQGATGTRSSHSTDFMRAPACAHACPGQLLTWSARVRAGPRQAGREVRPDCPASQPARTACATRASWTPRTPMQTRASSRRGSLIDVKLLDVRPGPDSRQNPVLLGHCSPALDDCQGRRLVHQFACQSAP